jgi:hypothetical protein
MPTKDRGQFNKYTFSEMGSCSSDYFKLEEL